MTRDKFTTDHLRDGQTLWYFVGFRTHAAAALPGYFNIGIKEQRHTDPTVPNFRGLVMGSAVTVIAADRVKLDLTGRRDIAYSYDNAFPFYIEQGGGVTATGRLSTRFDVIAGAREEWLEYRQTVGTPVAPRTDRTLVTDIGFLYTMGGGASHFGLTLEQTRRKSPLAQKNYRTRQVLSNVKFSF